MIIQICSIALIPSISKIFEKVILLQLTKYLDENNLICEKQYGFRKNHSTEYAALHIVDFLNYQLDANEIPISVYLDLSKAFDSLRHNILLDKIKHLGITGLAYKLLQSYLLNRQQYVAFKNCRSDLNFINNGVPQGSILGPMLFLIYINDFPNVSKLFNFIMYADDTSLFFLKEDFIRKSTKTTLLTKYIHICTSHHQLHLQTLHIIQNSTVLKTYNLLTNNIR